MIVLKIMGGILYGGIEGAAAGFIYSYKFMFAQTAYPIHQAIDLQ